MSVLSRSAAVLALTAGLGAAALVGAASASAHVRVTSADAIRGGYAVVTFRVPTESDTASTTGVRIQLPADQPLASVSVQPHAGWSYTATRTALAKPVSTGSGTIREAVTVIDWKADSAASAIRPGEFDEFSISAGPLPQATSMTFKAIQTYSDGSAVSWIEQPAPGSTTAPEHPAPVLQLAAATAATSSIAASAVPTVTATTQASGPDSSGTATTGVVLGIVGVVLGAAALAVTLLRRPRRAV